MRHLKSIRRALCLILLMALCSGAMAQEQPKVGISCPYSPDGWLAAAYCSAETTAEALGMRYFLKAATDAQAQIEDLELMTEQGYETIVLFPVSDEVESAARRAQRKGVTLLSFGSVPGKLKPAQRMVFEDEQTGVLGAEYLGETLSGRGRVALVALASDAAGERRAAACRDALAKEYPEMEIIGSFTADEASAEAGQALMTGILKDNPQLDGVYCCDAALAIGMLCAMEAQGRLGADGVRVLLSCGGSREYFARMEEYADRIHLAAQTYAPAALGELVRLCDGLTKGEGFQDSVLLPETLDAENYREWMLRNGITDEVPF